MGIKPACGWLALLLFTTAAHAEGTGRLAPMPVVGKTKGTASRSAEARAKPVSQTLDEGRRGGVTVLETLTRPLHDYDVEVFAGAPLDTPLAKELGLAHGLVRLALTGERRSGYRIAKESIRRIVRLGVVGLQPRERLDVLETEDGVVLVETISHAGGMFVTSNVYAFARGASLERRVGALLPGQDRLREALVVAEWAPTRGT